MVVIVGNLGKINEMIDNTLEQKRYTSFAKRLTELTGYIESEEWSNLFEDEIRSEYEDDLYEDEIDDDSGVLDE